MACQFIGKLGGTFSAKTLRPFFEKSHKGIVRELLKHEGSSYLITGASSDRFYPPLTSLMMTSHPVPKPNLRAGFLQNTVLMQSAAKHSPSVDFMDKKALEPALLKLSAQVFKSKDQCGPQHPIEFSEGIQRRALNPEYQPDYSLYNALDIPINRQVFAIEKTLSCPRLHPLHMDVFAEKIVVIPLHLTCDFEFSFWGPSGLVTYPIEDDFYYSFDPKIPHASLTKAIAELPLQRKTLHVVVMDPAFKFRGL